MRQKVAKAIRRRLLDPRSHWRTTWLTMLGLWLFPRWMERRQQRRIVRERAARRTYYRKIKQVYNRSPKRGAP